jgi:hypothetical protein
VNEAEATKKCTRCGAEKPHSEYYLGGRRHKRCLNSWCKTCQNEWGREYSKINRERIRIRAKEYRHENPDLFIERARAVYPRRAAKIKEWARNNKEKRCETSRVSRQKFPEKFRARAALHKALRLGVLKRGRCEVCGAEKTQAHHDDYSKPLEVRFLCPKHHMEIHRRKRA